MNSALALPKTPHELCVIAVYNISLCMTADRLQSIELSSTTDCFAVCNYAPAPVASQLTI